MLLLVNVQLNSDRFLLVAARKVMPAWLQRPLGSKDRLFGGRFGIRASLYRMFTRDGVAAGGAVLQAWWQQDTADFFVTSSEG